MLAEKITRRMASEGSHGMRGQGRRQLGGSYWRGQTSCAAGRRHCHSASDRRPHASPTCLHGQRGARPPRQQQSVRQPGAEEGRGGGAARHRQRELLGAELKGGREGDSQGVEPYHVPHDEPVLCALWQARAERRPRRHALAAAPDRRFHCAKAGVPHARQVWEVAAGEERVGHDPEHRLGWEGKGKVRALGVALPPALSLSLTSAARTVRLMSDCKLVTSAIRAGGGMVAAWWARGGGE